ncbi:MAG: hypothetical protein QXQ94_08815 [Candidatus Bathyarchaeia archaeon]
MEVSGEVSALANYQRKMEEFYNDLLDVWFRGCFGLYTDVFCEEEPYVLHPDIELVFFEDVLNVDPNDPEQPMLRLLGSLVKRGWQIKMNFMARNCLLGNVVVKIGDKWFAFGQCRRDDYGEPYVAEIWPLKYVLPRIEKMEVKLKYAKAIREEALIPP